jgi:V/A-type H+-transporting ATPase subunit E
MTGIEKITGRIQGDAAAEVQEILAQGQKDADAVTARYADQAEQAINEQLSRGESSAAQREARLISAAEMQAKQQLLQTRQTLLDEAFALALNKLQTQPEAEMIALLAQLAAKASVTGREEIILSKDEGKRYGAQVAEKANELLGKRGRLTLSKKAGAFQGGLVLSDGEVEVNCTFATLVRLARSQMAGEVAKVLFD